jgi:hypothetical protein
MSIIFLLFSVEESSTSAAERPSSAPINIPISENIDRIQRPSTGSSVRSSIHTPRSSTRSKKLPKITEFNNIHQQFKQEKSIRTDTDNRILTQKESSTGQTSRSSFEQKPYNHDVLVIQTQPPKVNKNYNKSKNSFILFIF